MDRTGRKRRRRRKTRAAMAWPEIVVSYGFLLFDLCPFEHWRLCQKGVKVTVFCLGTIDTSKASGSNTKGAKEISRRETENILQARESGKGVLTSSFKLLPSNHIGVIMTFPVYKPEPLSNMTPAE